MLMILLPCLAQCLSMGEAALHFITSIEKDGNSSSTLSFAKCLYIYAFNQRCNQTCRCSSMILPVILKADSDNILETKIVITSLDRMEEQDMTVHQRPYWLWASGVRIKTQPCGHLLCKPWMLCDLRIRSCR